MPRPDRASSAWTAPSAPRAVAQFMLAGLAAAAVFVLGSLVVLRELGQREALRNARDFALLAGRGIVEPVLTNGILVGDRGDLDRLDRLVQERVLGERVVRIKLWAMDGRVLYSDEPRLIGTTYPLGLDERAVLSSGATHAERSDLTRPENRYERGQGDVYEVYTSVRAQNGTPLLFETYQPASALGASGRALWRPFAIVLLPSLILLWLVQVPLAWRLARRLQRSQAERESLLVRAFEASVDERRRIASDLHDGVVQDLAGVSYSLEAATDRIAPQVAPELTAPLRQAAATARGAIRQLRTLLVEIHPPNLRSAGLRAAIGDLLAPLAAAGAVVELDVPADTPVSPATEQLLFRVAAEAIRNIQRHAGAHRVTVAVTASSGRVSLVVTDDGVGFSPADREQRQAAGHIGLALLEELATREGGSLTVDSAPGRGTRLELEVSP